MYFDSDGKFIPRHEIFNNHLFRSYEYMNNNRLCKTKCIQFKARKPPTGGRYEAGQFRCQTCEIYLTEQGVEGNSCKCCNMRVRSKPRNSLYKEKYHDKIRNSHEPWISTNENFDLDNSYDKIEYEPESNKKSTPIYDEIDESVKTYYELKDFLDTIKLQSNYQLVMLKELLEYGELHKGEIAESLAYFNNKNTKDINQVKYYFDVPVYDVLLKHGFVLEDEGALDLPYYSLNVKIEDFQRMQLIDYLSNELEKYNSEHGIPENQHPNADNMRNFDWSDYYLKSSIQKIKKFVKKINPTTSRSSWIWSVTPENWEIVKSKNIWGSRIKKERIGLKIKSGDQVAFYVIGSNSFKGIFTFVGEWFDSPGVTWEDDLEPDGSLRYRSQIQLKPIQLGSVNVPDLYDEMELFIDKPQNIRNLILQSGSGYPSNNSRPLLKEDFEILKQHLSENPEIEEPKIDEIEAKIVKECPKCHQTKVEGYPGIEFENKIEELFGYRQFDPNDPESKKPQSYCRKCRSQSPISGNSEDKLENEILEQDDSNNSSIADTRLFDYNANELSIKNCKILNTTTIQKGQILSNDEIISNFKVGNMGGIRYTKQNDVIVLLSTYSDDYDDSIDTDSGLIIYTGEGKGDQELKNGNEKILNSQNTPMIFFKEVYQEPGTRPRGALDNKYQFVGLVKYRKHYWKTEKDRKVVKFVLEIQS